MVNSHFVMSPRATAPLTNESQRRMLGVRPLVSVLIYVCGGERVRVWARSIKLGHNFRLNQVVQRGPLNKTKQKKMHQLQQSSELRTHCAALLTVA